MQIKVGNELKIPLRQKGTVLMEFLVVLPLYFALIGGLLFVGELIINRVRLQIGDFAVTWMGADRFSDAQLCTSSMGFLFEEKFDGLGRYCVNESEDDAKVNRFCALHLGGVDLDIRMPQWIRGMLFMQDAVTRANEDYDDSDPKWDELEWHSYWGDGQDERKSLFRSFSVHRIMNDDSNYERMRSHVIDGTQRGRVAADLLMEKVLLNVLSDRWVNNVTDDSMPVGASGSLSDVTSSARPRVLWELAQ